MPRPNTPCVTRFRFAIPHTQQQSNVYTVAWNFQSHPKKNTQHKNGLRERLNKPWHCLATEPKPKPIPTRLFLKVVEAGGGLKRMYVLKPSVAHHIPRQRRHRVGCRIFISPDCVPQRRVAYLRVCEGKLGCPYMRWASQHMLHNQRARTLPSAD